LTLACIYIDPPRSTWPRSNVTPGYPQHPEALPTSDTTGPSRM